MKTILDIIQKAAGRHPGLYLKIDNPSTILREAASTYKVDTNAIAAKVKQEFTAKEKAKKTPQPAVKAAKKAA
jgi:hypothetical protein